MVAPGVLVRKSFARHIDMSNIGMLLSFGAGHIGMGIIGMAGIGMPTRGDIGMGDAATGNIAMPGTYDIAVPRGDIGMVAAPGVIGMPAHIEVIRNIAMGDIIMCASAASIVMPGKILMTSPGVAPLVSMRIRFNIGMGIPYHKGMRHINTVGSRQHALGNP